MIAAGACGAAEPLRILGLADGLEIAPHAVMVCPVAEALAQWAAKAVVPAAREHLDAVPTAIAVGTSYECRGRNRRPGAKLSEHAFANALDVMSFAFEKRASVVVRFHAEDTPEARYQAAIREKACTHFTTVLGPGSDETHADHLHLDLRARKGGFRLCQ